jgi:hypothetical protein
LFVLEMNSTPALLFNYGFERLVRVRVLLVSLSLLSGILAGCGSSSDAASGRTPPLSGGRSLECEATYSLVDSVSIETLHYRVDYPDAADVDPTDCVNILPYTGVTVNDQDGALSIMRAATRPFDGPVSLDTCRFGADRELTEDDFAFSVVDASLGLESLRVLPEVRVARVTCRPRGETISTTTTTTTLSCWGVSCAEGELCSEGICTPADRYTVDFGIREERIVGALQLEVRYPCARMQAVGSDTTIECRLFPDLDGFAAFRRHEDDDVCVSGAVSVAMVFPRGARTPRSLFTCAFDSDHGPPDDADFAISVLDASDISGHALGTVTPTVANWGPIDLP